MNTAAHTTTRQFQHIYPDICLSVIANQITIQL